MSPAHRIEGRGVCVEQRCPNLAMLKNRSPDGSALYSGRCVGSIAPATG